MRWIDRSTCRCVSNTSTVHVLVLSLTTINQEAHHISDNAIASAAYACGRGLEAELPTT